MDIGNLNKSDLKDLLKKLSLYKNLRRKLWKRWIKAYDNIINWKNEYKVEYFSAMDKDYVLKESIETYQKAFWVKPDISEIEIIENANLKWWMKLYFNDNLVDMSFSKVSALIK